MVIARCRSRAAGIALGYLADRVFADPRRGHPVAGFGRLAAGSERLSYRDGRAAGALHTTVLVGGAVIAGALVEGRAEHSAVRVAVVGLGTWAALGGTTLARTGTAMADLLADGDIPGARDLLPSLCGRDPASLDEAGLTRAALESVAENTSDATVAPLLWAAIAGLPGVLGYRAVNTLDAMIGHRSARYARFGWAAARLDDIANYPAARLAGLLTALCAPVAGGSVSGAVLAWRRDAARHPSPNAGVAEAAFAGALGVRLGGPTQYRHQLEIRPTLGDGRPPDVGDLRRGVRLSQAVQLAAVVVAVGITVVCRNGRRACPRW